jgi:dTMP kinase
MATVMYIFDVIHSVRVMRKAKKNNEYDDFIFVRYIMAVSYLPRPLAKLAYKFFEIALPTPDVKIFVDVTGPTAMARINARGEQLETFETEEQLTDTREKMLMFIPKGWYLVDNNGSFEESKTQIYGILKEVNDGDP